MSSVNFEEMLKEKELVIRAMDTYGGSFIKSFAETLYRADPENTFKLKIAFSEYWEKYLDIGIRMKSYGN